MASKDTKLKIIVDAENRSQGTFNALKRNLDDIKRSHEGLISAMKGVGAMGAVAFGALSLLSKGIIEAGVGFEQTQIAFDTMLGSAEVASKTLADLASFAKRTPFELPQLEEASKRLLAYGTSADELIPTLEMLGNISAGVGMDKLPLLILAFGQVKAATKLTGMELRQFSEAGVPLLGTLARQLNVTEGAVQEMVSNGEISFNQMKAALASLSAEGGKFFNLMERQSRSLGGLWSNLKDQIGLTARAIGTELLPYLKPLVEQMIVWAQVVGEFVKEHPKLSAGILIAALAFTALLAVLLPIAFALPGIILMFQGLAAVFLFVASGPGLVITLAILEITAALMFMHKSGLLTAEGWRMVWLGIKLTVAESVNAITGLIEGMINWVIEGINAMIDKINSFIASLSQIPMIGKQFAKLSLPKLESVSFNRIDTDAMVSSSLGQNQAQQGPQLVVTGNVLLDDNAAETIGDMILKRLKLSNAL